MTRNLPDDFATVANPPSYEPDGEHSMYSPDTVDEWPCRRCGQPSAVTAGGLEGFATWNAILAKRGEAPLDPSKILLCDPCLALFRVAVAEKRTEQASQVAMRLRRLKDPSTPRHILGEDEVYVTKYANEGGDLVKRAGEARLKATKRSGGL